MRAPNYHKIEQNAFYHFNGLKGTMDNAREALRELFPIGTIISTTLLEDVTEREFRVVKVSTDRYDLDHLAALTVVDSEGDEYLLQWFGEESHTITVISRPAPPPPPAPPAPEPWTAGEGWYLLPKDTPLQPGDGYVHPDYHAHGFIDYGCRPDLFREEKGGKATAHMWQWRRQKPATQTDPKP